MSYADLLLDPRWQKKRLEVLTRDEWTCQRCDAKDKTLHVHHFLYHGNAPPWDAPMDELATVCEPCHGELTEQKASLREAIFRFEQGFGPLDRVIAYLQAFVAWYDDEGLVVVKNHAAAYGIAQMVGVDTAEVLSAVDPEDSTVCIWEVFGKMVKDQHRMDFNSLLREWIKRGLSFEPLAEWMRGQLGDSATEEPKSEE
jgi:hypothetical protein